MLLKAWDEEGSSEVDMWLRQDGFSFPQHIPCLIFFLHLFADEETMKCRDGRNVWEIEERNREA